MKMDTKNTDLVFNVAQLLKEAVGSTRKLELNTPELKLENEQTSPEAMEPLTARDVHGNVKVTRSPTECS